MIYAIVIDFPFIADIHNLANFHIAFRSLNFHDILINFIPIHIWNYTKISKRNIIHVKQEYGGWKVTICFGNPFSRTSDKDHDRVATRPTGPTDNLLHHRSGVRCPLIWTALTPCCLVVETKLAEVKVAALSISSPWIVSDMASVVTSANAAPWHKIILPLN